RRRRRRRRRPPQRSLNGRRARPASLGPAPPGRRAAALRLPRIPPRPAPHRRARESLVPTLHRNWICRRARVRSLPPPDYFPSPRAPPPGPTSLSSAEEHLSAVRDASLCEPRHYWAWPMAEMRAWRPLVRPSLQCVKLGRATARWWWVVKVKPHNKDTRMKYHECNKIVKQKAFERAIAGDEHKRSVVDSLDIQSMTIKVEYRGPKLEDDKVTVTFMKGLMQ
ncbi:uncharacterized protein LOC116478311, partial [Hylobates moloch]|uniref:uncharacterized protein LOC116478311 n=1 Tax=Hylobates moloch TaxID=81572 RepID=UPI002675A5F4